MDNKELKDYIESLSVFADSVHAVASATEHTVKELVALHWEMYYLNNLRMRIKQ